MEFSEGVTKSTKWLRLADLVAFLRQQDIDLDNTLISFYSAMHRKFVKTHVDSLNDLIYEKDIETIDGVPALRIRLEKAIEINSDSEHEESETEETNDKLPKVQM